MKMRTGTVSLAALFLLAAVPVTRAGEVKIEKKDIILLEDGTEKKVDAVQEENYASVTFKLGGQPRKIKASLVKEVIYYDAPQAYRNGRGMMNQKKFKDAIANFETAQRASGVRDWIKTYSVFNIAQCYRFLGMVDDSNFKTAAEYYDTLLKEAPLTRFLPAALYYKGEALTRAKKYAKADETFLRLITEVGTKSLDEKWSRLADLAQAKVKEAKGHFDEASAKYTSIYNLYKSTDPAVANMAQLRKGLCLIAQKKYRDAKKYFQNLGRSAKGEDALAREIKAGASIGMGHCFLNDKNYLEARHWFLDAMVVNFSDEFGPQAMYHSALCYEHLKSKEKGADAKAKLIFSDLIKRYPTSKWSKKARDKGYKELPN